MKILIYLYLALLCTSCSAQGYYIIDAVHKTNIGGVRGSRSEIFDIVVTHNPKMEIKYLLSGNIIIPLKKRIQHGKIYLHAIYFPDSPDQISIDAIDSIDTNEVDLIFDFNYMFLISENIISKKEIKQKINFLHKNGDHHTISSDQHSRPE